MTAPTPKDVICDPACGTAGFLIAASEYLLEHHGDAICKTAASRRKFNSGTFHGYDFDSTMLRIGSMNISYFHLSIGEFAVNINVGRLINSSLYRVAGLIVFKWTEPVCDFLLKPILGRRQEFYHDPCWVLPEVRHGDG